MRGKYKKYTEEEKAAHVMGYLKLSESHGLSQKRYAERNDIPITSFRRWVSEYDSYGSSSDNTDDKGSRGTFIMISEDHSSMNEPGDQNLIISGQKIRLCYKDAVLEFPSDQLRDVMEMLQLW